MSSDIFYAIHIDKLKNKALYRKKIYSHNFKLALKIQMREMQSQKK